MHICRGHIWLYIPIWFYSNWQIAYKALYQKSFTFQSGSIQIAEDSRAEKRHKPLHSNLVLFKFKHFHEVGLCKMSLHSNLVLFKCNFNNDDIPPLITLHSNLVLFKSVLDNETTSTQFSLHSNLVLFK